MWCLQRGLGREWWDVEEVSLNLLLLGNFLFPFGACW